MLLTIDFCCKPNCPLGTLKVYSIMSKLQANMATVNFCKSGHPKQPCSKLFPPPPIVHPRNSFKQDYMCKISLWFGVLIILFFSSWARPLITLQRGANTQYFLHCEGAIVLITAAAPQLHTHQTTHTLRQTHQHHICTPNPLKSAHFETANKPGSCLAMLLRPQALLAHIT